MSEKIHEKYGPSSADRWIPCPFSLTVDSPRLPTAASLLGDEAHDLGAEILDNPDRDVHVPSHLRTGVRMYTDHVLARNVKPIVERKWMSMQLAEYGGTIDALLVQNHTAVVYDYKNGRYGVPIENNAQLLCYSDIVSEHFEIDTFIGIIVQPNGYRGPKVKKTEFTVADVAQHRLRVIDAMDNPNRKETGQQCRWSCAAKY